MGVRSKITKRIPVPDELGQWIEIQMVSWITLVKSRQERLVQLITNHSIFTSLQEFARSNGGMEEAKAAAAADLFQQHDQMTLLRHGLVAWSYSDTVDPEELDEKTAEWAAREILAYTLPGEAETKTNSSRSTGTDAARDRRRKHG